MCSINLSSFGYPSSISPSESLMSNGWDPRGNVSDDLRNWFEWIDFLEMTWLIRLSSSMQKRSQSIWIIIIWVQLFSVIVLNILKMISKVLIFLLALALVGESCLAWTNNNCGNERSNQRTNKVSSVEDRTNPLDEAPISTRRSVLAAIPAISTLLVSNAAFAKDDLFKSNPLTNQVLEQVSQIIVDGWHRHPSQRWNPKRTDLTFPMHFSNSLGYYVLASRNQIYSWRSEFWNKPKPTISNTAVNWRLEMPGTREKSVPILHCWCQFWR